MKTLNLTAAELVPGDVIASGSYAGQVVTESTPMHGSMYMTYRTEKVTVVTSRNSQMVVDRDVPSISETINNDLVSALVQCRNILLYGGASFVEKSAAVTRANAALSSAGVA